MKLFGFKNARSNRVEWMLQELGVAYDFVKVDLLSGEQKKSDHVERHAHALIPALEDGNVHMIESAAMCLYLADKYSEKGLGVPSAAADKARYYQLSVYAVSTLDACVLPLFFHTVLFPPEKRDPSIVEAKTPIWETAADLLERELGDSPFLAGKSFTAADVIVGYDLAIASRMGLLKKHPMLAAYTERVTSREAFKRAYAP